MSGIKTTYTTIADDELRRLHNLAAQATSLQERNQILNQLSAKNEAALAEYRSQINRLSGNMEQLNRRLAEQGAAASQEAQALRNQLQQTIRDSNARIQEAARQNERQIQTMRQSFTKELTRTRADFDAAIDQTRADMTATMEANNRRIEAAMQQNNRRIEKEMETLESRMEKEMEEMCSRLKTVETSIRTSEENKSVLLDMAREYYRMANALVQDIRDNHRAELLCPGRLQPVVDILMSSQEEIRLVEKGNLDNATGARIEAKKAANDALKLYQDVICAEQEWMMHFQAARQVLDATEAQLEASRSLSLPEMAGITVDVDRWTDGDLEVLENRLSDLENRMKASESLALSDLDEIQSAGVQASREIDDTSMFAVEAIYASQDRGEIAQDIADQLRGYGLTVVAHSYCGEDQRSAHRLHMKNNRTGFEIVITQTPVLQNGKIANRLESDILNFGTDEQEDGDRIAREILASLSGLGLVQTDVETRPGYEHSESGRMECRDMQKWKTEQTPEVARPDHAERSVVKNAS